MTKRLTPVEVRALRLLRRGAPTRFVALTCGISTDAVMKLRNRWKNQNHQKCWSAKLADELQQLQPGQLE